LLPKHEKTELCCGKPYYWIGGGPMGFDHTPGSDCVAVADGYIAVTPLKVDTTHLPLKEKLESTLRFKW
jgi:5'-nucleotidase